MTCCWANISADCPVSYPLWQLQVALFTIALVVQGTPVARKAIVVAPATLVANWGKEVKKWLGQERMGFIQLSTVSI